MIPTDTESASMGFEGTRLLADQVVIALSRVVSTPYAGEQIDSLPLRQLTHTTAVGIWFRPNLLDHWTDHIVQFGHGGLLELAAPPD